MSKVATSQQARGALCIAIRRRCKEGRHRPNLVPLIYSLSVTNLASIRAPIEASFDKLDANWFVAAIADNTDAIVDERQIEGAYSSLLFIIANSFGLLFMVIHWHKRAGALGAIILCWGANAFT